MAGELDRAADPHPTSLRARARTFTRGFNDSPDDDSSALRAILARLLGGVGQLVEVEPPFRCDYGCNIRVGDRVWIGGGAIILPGVTIGDEAVIAAGSVVTGDVAPGALVAGHPARLPRHLTPMPAAR